MQEFVPISISHSLKEVNELIAILNEYIESKSPDSPDAIKADNLRRKIVNAADFR